MEEGQEILTAEKKIFSKYFIPIIGLTGIIFLITSITIALILEDQNSSYWLLVRVFFEFGMLLIFGFYFLFIGVNIIEPLTNKPYKLPFHYKVIYFNDRLVFKKYSKNEEIGNFQIFYPQIKSFDQENDRVSVKLVFGILDDEIQKNEGYNWIDKGNTTSEIEKQRFRTSKKLSKSDRVRIFDFLNMHIERSKSA